MHPTRPLSRRALLTGAVAGGALGVAAGAGGMLAAFPYLFPPPAANDPPLPVATAADVTATRPAAAGDTGASPRRVFRFDERAPGRDPIHWADGTGLVARADGAWTLRLNPDFRAGPGPNFWLYLNTTAVGEERDFEADRRRVKLAPLRAFTGAQNYRLPAGLNPTAFHTLTVWCETFGVYIASGALTAEPLG